MWYGRPLRDCGKTVRGLRGHCMPRSPVCVVLAPVALAPSQPRGCCAARTGSGAASWLFLWASRAEAENALASRLGFHHDGVR